MLVENSESKEYWSKVNSDKIWAAAETERTFETMLLAACVRLATIVRAVGKARAGSNSAKMAGLAATDPAATLDLSAIAESQQHRCREESGCWMAEYCLPAHC